MADHRIRPPKDKEALIVKLTRDESGAGGVFQTRAHLLTFAAVYGLNKQVRRPFTDGLEPIRQEVFARNGFDTMINLIALADTQDPKCLAQTDEADALRIAIFEEYANGGLEHLRGELIGVDDAMEHMLLMLGKVRTGEQDGNGFVLGELL